MWKIFLNYIFRIMYYCVCISICLYVYIHTTFMLGASRYQKRVVDSPELESRIVVVHMGAEKQIQVLCLSSHLFRPYVGNFFYLILREMGNHRAIYFFLRNFEIIYLFICVYVYVCTCMSLYIPQVQKPLEARRGNQNPLNLGSCEMPQWGAGN